MIKSFMHAAAITMVCAITTPMSLYAVKWVGGSGGTEDEPLDLYDSNNWEDHKTPSTASHYELTVDAPTVLTNSNPNALTVSNANWFRPYQGEFTFLGPLFVNVFGYGSPAGRATIIKKGDWIVCWDFNIANAEGSYMKIHNVSGSLTHNQGSTLNIAPGKNSTAEIVNESGDWMLGQPVYVASGSGSSATIVNESGNWTWSRAPRIASGNGSNATLHFKSGDLSCASTENVSVSAGQNSKATVKKDGGNWFIEGQLRIGDGAASTAEFYHTGGVLTVRDFIILAPNDSVERAYFEISGGEVNIIEQGYVQLGENGPATMTVKSGGKFSRIGEQDGASMWISMRNGPGVLNIDGGEVLLGGRLGCHYWEGTKGSSTINVTGGGILTMKSLYQKSGNSAVNINIDNGILRAYADEGEYLPLRDYLAVKVGNGGATFDCNGKKITIKANLNNADGATAPLTFKGDDGEIRLEGAINTTGPISVASRTHLIVKDAAMKNAILDRGLTIIKPVGSPKGETYTLFSIADDTPCTEDDLKKINLSSDLSTGKLSIEGGAIVIKVDPWAQNWGGESGVEASWNGSNWDKGVLFDNGNNAVFAINDAIVKVDDDISALSIVFNANTEIKGSASLNVPVIEVADDVTAKISAPIPGSFEKIGAGTLELSTSRTDDTKLIEGSLVMKNGATLSGNLTLGMSEECPVTLDMGDGSLVIPGFTLKCDVTLRNGKYSIGNFTPDGPNKSLYLEKGVEMTMTDYSQIENGGSLVIDGAIVRNTKGYVQPGNRSPGTMTVKNGGYFERIGESDGGSLWLSMREKGSGTLNINGGEVYLGGALGIHYWGGSGETSINITDGGKLTMSRMFQQSGNSAVNVKIDNGTIRAYQDNNAFIPNRDYITVNIAQGGATVDANGKSITIAKQLTGTGSVKYLGKGVVTLGAVPAYVGKTVVEVGTTLILPNTIAGNNLEFTLPAEIENGVYEIVRIEGGDVFDSQIVESISKPEGARVVLGPNKKSIYYLVGEFSNEQVWLGGSSGNLSDSANWLNGRVPVNGEVVILSATPATLDVGDKFTPDTIVFASNSVKITITGSGINSVSSIINHSSVAHEFICPVNAEHMTLSNDSVSCVFTGGITVETFEFSNPGGERSDMRGIWTINAETWTPPANLRINSDGNVTLNGKLVNSTEIIINEGGVLTASSYLTNGGNIYPAKVNNGSLVITGIMEIANISNDFNFSHSADNATIIVGGIYINTGKWLWCNAKNLVIGSDGIRFAQGKTPELRFKNNPTLYSRDGVLTLHLGENKNHQYSINGTEKVTICTTKWGTENEPAVVNLEGIVHVNSGDGYKGGMIVNGCGKVVFNSQSTFIGGLQITDSATVAVNDGCTPGNGTVSVGANATFAVAESGNVALGGKLTLAEGAKLQFNFTDNIKAPRLTGTAVEVAGAVNVLLTTDDGVLLRSGVHTLTGGIDFSGKTLSLVEEYDWVKSLEVVDGNIVLNVRSRGTVIRVR